MLKMGGDLKCSMANNVPESIIRHVVVLGKDFKPITTLALAFETYSLEGEQFSRR